MAHAKDKEKIEELQGESKQSADSPIHQAADQASEQMLEQVEGLTLKLFHEKLQNRAFGDSFRRQLQEILQTTPQTFEARIIEQRMPAKLLTPNQSNA
ncbi:hypothetical protein NG799_02375 [Laspinema sp. D1]|uniref:Uncharacterized protein n=1 Tax=Laspinema palackyanum D2a TaxID=2953684 RepID=A0ABT2MKA8_9CYAN|nr:hypothetical protein [Laspinema sp. D2a]